MQTHPVPENQFLLPSAVQSTILFSQSANAPLTLIAIKDHDRNAVEQPGVHRLSLICRNAREEKRDMGHVL